MGSEPPLRILILCQAACKPSPCQLCGSLGVTSLSSPLRTHHVPCSVLGIFDIISLNLHSCSTLVPTFLMVQVRQERPQVAGLHGQS